MSIYIHIPFCMKKCNYCDFLSGVYDEDTQVKYVDAICKEIEYMGQRLEGVAVPSIFIGGGTPSWLDGVHIERIMSAVYDNFNVPGSAEITIECNPGTVTGEKFLAIRRAGINRISIGLQSADDEELKLLGRVHDFNQFLRTYEMARKTGFTNINVDIMTGLPGQTKEKLLNTLENVIRLKPAHISAYSLIIEEGTPFYNLYKEDVHRRECGEPTVFLPNEDAEYDLTKMTEQVLSQHGYHQYEISNFARDGFECEHNKVYWQRGQYIGFGIGAASLIGDCRYHNMTDIYEYIEKCNKLPVASNQTIEARLSGEAEEIMYLWDSSQTLSRHDQMEEFMFLGLRMNQGVRREDFKEAFGCEIEGVYREQLEKLQQEGLLVMEGGHIYLTERGRDISNVVLSEFLFD
ncbi:MAG: radical SAM family heme chaperone HemW [Lachnospiraceae bacterium]|nr:radical SAM family heme chaperone HemW [Lachnospiraceae bacterium]